MSFFQFFKKFVMKFKRVRVFFVIILSITMINGFCQSNPIEKFRVQTAGIGQLIDGFCKVNFDKVADTNSYYVILTPIGEYAELFVLNKNQDFFIVKSNIVSNAKFDFILIVKQPNKTLEADSKMRNKH